MANDKNKHVSDKDANIKGKTDDDKVYIDGQNREMIDRRGDNDKKNPLVWITPIILVLLILPLVIHLFDGDDSETEGGSTPSAPGDTEESGETQEGSDSGSEEEAGGSDEGLVEDDTTEEEGTEEETTEEETAEEGSTDEEDTEEESPEDESAGGEEEPSEPQTSEGN